MRYVDEVVMRVPINPTDDFIKSFEINTVVRGSLMDVTGSRHNSSLERLKSPLQIVTIDSDSVRILNVIMFLMSHNHAVLILYSISLTRSSVSYSIYFCRSEYNQLSLSINKYSIITQSSQIVHKFVSHSQPNPSSRG